MLPRVLLHVIEPTVPVNMTSDRSPGSKRTLHKMPDRSPLVLYYLFYGNLQRRPTGRSGSHHACIKRLSAARWIEGRAVQRYLPHGIAIYAREFADFSHRCGKGLEK